MKALLRTLEAWRVGSRLGFVVAPHRAALGGAVALQLLVVALAVLQPWPMQVAFDRVLSPVAGAEPGGADLLLLCAAVLFGVVVARVLAEYAANLLVAKVGHRVTRALRMLLFRRLLELPPSFHGGQRSGDLLMRLMGDAPMVKTMLVEASTNLLARGLHAVAVLAIMVRVDAGLTAALLVLVPALALVVRVLSRRLSVAIRKQRRKEGALADFLGEAVGAVTLVQSLGREEEVAHRFARDNRRSARAELKAARAAARLSASVESLLTLGVALTLLLGGQRVLEGALTPGELLVFLSYVRGLLKPARSAAKHQARVAKGVACAERLLEVLAERSPLREQQGEREPAARPERVELQGVHYAYPDGRVALQEVDATFERGQLTALVGASGAGKSTLVALLLRLMDPTRGRVVIDGVALPEFRLDSLREGLAAALQDAVLFGTSVRENLLLAAPDADDAALQQALEDAGAAQVVAAMPDGLDTVLGSSGLGLSGGQRRRLCLARAFLRDAGVLVVDEPFAGLDGEAARHVFTSLRQRASNAIVIVVTHDQEHLDGFDQVVWIQEEGPVASGSHAELSAGSAAYREAFGADGAAASAS